MNMYLILLNHSTNPFLTSMKEYGPLIAPFVSILIAWLAAKYAIKKFFQQQKTERLQKIYYEDAIIKQFVHIENLLSVISKNSILFSSLNNYVHNKITVAQSILQAESQTSNGLEEQDSALLEKFKKITSSNYIQEIVEQIQLPSFIFASNNITKILNASSPESGNYFNKWLHKTNLDVFQITSRLKNISANYVDYLVSDQNYIPLEIKALSHNSSRLNSSLRIIERDVLLLNVASDLKLIMASKDYKNEKTLIESLRKDKEFLSVAQKIINVYKILYYWVKKDNYYLSVAENRDNKRYRVTFDPDGKINGLSETDEELSNDDVFIELEISQEIEISDYSSDDKFNLYEKLFEIASNAK